MTILVASDKFKGSLSATEACSAIKKGILEYDNTIKVLTCPMADGGDGSLKILEEYESLDSLTVPVYDPLMRPIKAAYKTNKQTAYIEMAAASGLMLLAKKERNCMHTTTFGTGQLILNAIQKGMKNIYLFIGGSATNDGGIGMAAALGYRFLDQSDKELLPIGQSLYEIARIDDSNLFFDKNKIIIKVVSDVQNPLTGQQGAAWIYGAQKGADIEEIKLLDKGLNTLAKQLVKQTYPDINQLSGAGAAGGLGGGAVAFLGAELISGISFFIQKTALETQLKEVDLVITGEGHLDNQSLAGKVIHGVCRLAKQHKTPTMILCGRSEFQQIPSLNIEHIYSIMDISTSEKEAMEMAYHQLTKLAYQSMPYEK